MASRSIPGAGPLFEEPGALEGTGQEELAIGAVASDGTRVLNAAILRAEHVGEDYLDQITREQAAEALRRERRFRAGRAPLDLAGRSVIVVDDGLATGATMRAVVRSLRRGGVARLTVAVPVGAPETCRLLAEEIDELVCLHQPDLFRAVGAFYVNFGQTTDEKVEQLLTDARRRRQRRDRASMGATSRTA